MPFVASVLRMWVPVWVAAATLLGSSSVARGQTFACTEETTGQLSLQAGVRCQCVRVPEGSVTGAAAGYAWDCGVLHGRLNQLVPPEPDAYQGPLPEAIIVDAEQRAEGSRKPRRQQSCSWC